MEEIENDQLHPVPGGVVQGTSAASKKPLFQLPTMTRFLADFTLGFADGLTVPFALTAGLSSLGQTETVIYAGMAEICAGSISMGIGGYLSARGENAAALAKRAEDESRLVDDDSDSDYAGPSLLRQAGSETDLEKFSMEPTTIPKGADPVYKYLAPLDLPRELLDSVMMHLDQRPDVASTLVAKNEEAREEEELLPSSIVVGLSVAVGYLLGGLLPLFPYFLVSQVGDGLLWSFVVCIITLFIFGFAKDFISNREVEASNAARWNDLKKRKSVSWKDIRRSTWEGLQMVILGSVAALAAVLCVRLFEGMSTSSAESQP